MRSLLTLPSFDHGPRALFALMATQHGVASSAQARGLGVSRAVEQRLVAEGALVRTLPGVLVAGGVEPTFASRAKAATLRPGVLAISHRAAARIHRLSGFAEHETIDVIGARGSHIRGDETMVPHYSRGPIGQHIAVIGGIPVTSIPLTLTLVTPSLTRAEVVAALSDALDRGVPAAAIRTVAVQWRGHGRSGPATLIRLLDRFADRGSRSA